ncbi:MAG: PspC domain-containing protein [Bacteroidota bacterium]|nr:PspC domain-containing protein [Bacteroidota bacterium]
MKKIININFHSRVIPIEETAYEILQNYMDSLRKHFLSEEGGDEIVNDIENRFAELFSERLKNGASCITDDDVNATITNMGRPEDFDGEENSRSTGTTSNTAGAGTYTEAKAEEPHRSLYRSENDKMLGGVCGGLAAYLRIDSSVMRIIYTLLIFVSFGTALLLYIILWLVLPPKSMVTEIKKRLYRNPDQRVIGGVASGLAAYFNIEIWIPRLIFALPLIIGFLTSIFRHVWFDLDNGPVFFTGGFGGTLFVTYIILWIVLPEANTASEKLEMRGEKIDLESIKNTIKGDLEGFKQKASQVGDEMKKQAQQFGTQIRNKSADFSRNMSSGRSPRRGIGHAIGVLFKAFFLFIAVIFTFALVMALIGLIFTGAGVLPLKNFIIGGFWQNILAWGAVLLFLILPVVGLLTWLIRRIIGARKGSNYLGYIFGSLWIIGLICMLSLIASVSGDFRTRAGVSEEIKISAPANGKLIVKMNDIKPVVYESDWMDINWQHNSPFFEVTEDSLVLNTVRVDVVKSADSSWHMRQEKLSRGNTVAAARSLASQIDFNVEQRDSSLYLPSGFSIRPKQQFRNQQVMIVIELPIGKKIRMDRSLEDFHWFDFNRNWRHHGVDFNWDDNFENNNNSLESDVDYTMTDHGLERSSGSMRQEDPKNQDEDQPGNDDQKENAPKDGYRYHKKEVKKANKVVSAECSKDCENFSPLILFTGWS